MSGTGEKGCRGNGEKGLFAGHATANSCVPCAKSRWAKPPTEQCGLLNAHDRSPEAGNSLNSPGKNASDRQPRQLLRFIPSRLNLCHASPPCAYHLIAISEILPQSLQISWLMPPTACRLPAGAGKCFVIFSRRFADPAFLSSVFSEPHSGQGGHLFMAHSVSCMASLTDVNRHAKSEASPFSQPPMTNDFLQERQ